MKLRLTFWSILLGLAVSAVIAGDHAYNLPPAIMLMEPGPGVGGPGPGVLAPVSHPGAGICAVGVESTVQILFNRPEGMQVRWDVGGVGQFDSDPLVVPGRQNFPQGGIYRLKITNIPGHDGLELYPTLEVGPTTPRTEAFLAHNAIPIQFTEEDFDQVTVGNFVTKVIYLPDPEFQELALAGVETLVSTRLDPGVDPVVEADRRGAIMAVIRLGNKDLEVGGGLGGDGVVAAAFEYPGGAGFAPGACPPGMAGDYGGGGYGAGGALPTYVSGVTGPSYGMPITGTPIGLPGPPHIPLGQPVALQRYVMRNHTHMHIPNPPARFSVDMRQMPGYSYPKPANHVLIREQNIHPTLHYRQPLRNRTQVLPGPH